MKVDRENPENVIELNLKTSESELQEMWLSGNSLQLAKTFLKDYKGAIKDHTKSIKLQPNNSFGYDKSG